MEKKIKGLTQNVTKSTSNALPISVILGKNTGMSKFVLFAVYTVLPSSERILVSRVFISKWC